ncbi:S8 family serine peptidase [Lysobacter sp. TAF61]|uniref:S8 family serine peptidase n=1 Tax=Lysobacter sp. TAF61 TaxID=3233072 RepID=UPI003F9DDB85
MHYREEGLVTALRAALLCVAALAVVACGGGGGGGNVRSTPPPATPSAPPPPPPTPPVVFAANPDFSKHLSVTDALATRNSGITGAGVRIGVVDSGVVRSHPALSPRVVANLTYVTSPPNNLLVDDVVEHGTAVSQIMAGSAFGAWPGGIAPGAEIVSARILEDKEPADDGSGQGSQIDGALGLKAIHQDLINRGVRVMNNSWGGVYWTNPAATTQIADEYRPFVHGNGGLVVFATGNEASANPSSIASLPSQLGTGGVMTAADLEVGWLAVTAINPDNVQQLDIGSNGAVYANACGVAMNYCLAAPGTVVVTGSKDTPTNPTYWSWKGTSLAAPQVSGAAALVWQKFPYFNNDLVRQTLLGTARDLGTAGVDATFGYGLLDVGKALGGPAQLNWGTVTVAFDGAASTWSNAISGSGGLVKQGTGELVLNGSGSYTGATVVQGGRLRIGSGIVSPVTVSAAGTLAIGSGTTSSGASVGNSVVNQGTLLMDSGSSAITGNYQQSSAAHLALMVGARLSVGGTASLAGNVNVLGVLSGYVRSNREVFLNAGAINGQFDSLTAQPNVLLTATLGYDTQQVWLDITRLDVTAAAQSMGFSPTSVASAQRVEGAFDAIDDGKVQGDAAPDFVAGAGLIQGATTAAAVEQSLSSLSGELHGADTAFALMVIEGNRRALESRVDALQSAPVAGTWSNDLQAQRAMSRFDIDADGWMLGQDRRLGERLTVGMALSETEGYAHHELRSDREHNRQAEAQLYGAYDLGRGYLLGSVALGRMQRWTQRDILLGADAFRVDADYAQRYANLGLQAGLPLSVGRARITPYVGVQSLQLDRDGFSEQGAAGFGLSTTASTMTLGQGLLGARFAYDWRAGASLWSLEGRAEWQHLLSHSGGDIDARFTALDVWSPIVGEAADRDVGVLGLSLGTQFRHAGRIAFDLDTQRLQDQTWTRAMATWSMGW